MSKYTPNTEEVRQTWKARGEADRAAVEKRLADYAGTMTEYHTAVKTGIKTSLTAIAALDENGESNE